MDNGKTLDFSGDTEVRYADVTSGGEVITMLMCLCGGASARIETPLPIFMNNNPSYPIRRVPDDVPGVAYRTGPNDWMDNNNMLRWLRDPRVIKPLPNQSLRTIYIDYCSSHNMTEEYLDVAKNVELRFDIFQLTLLI